MDSFSGTAVDANDNDGRIAEREHNKRRGEARHPPLPPFEDRAQCALRKFTEIE
jgi:hypothetical protein